MTCPCNDTKRKMPRCNAGTPPVLEVHSKECPVLFHTVTIPASIGDLESMPPQPGAYHNARVIYEADNATYLYDSDGIPQLLVPDTESIITEAVSQIPTATTSAKGLMSAADKAKLDGLKDNIYSETETVVGTWIDGKPIYRKVFTGTVTNSANVRVNKTLWQASTVKDIVDAGGWVRYGTSGMNTALFTESTGEYRLLYVQNGTNDLNYGVMSGTAFTDRPYTIWVEYTKTTD